MTDRQAILNAVERHYAVRNAANPSNVDDLLGTLDPACRFQIAGSEQLGEFTQVCDTCDALRKAATTLVSAWDLSGLENVSIHIDGDTALVHRAGTVRRIAGDIPFHTEMIDKLKFRDGLIVEYTQFIDTYEVARVAAM